MKKASKNIRKNTSIRSKVSNGIATEKNRIQSILKDIEKAKIDRLAVLHNGKWSLKTDIDSIYDALMGEYNNNIKRVRHCLKDTMENEKRKTAKSNFALCGLDNFAFTFMEDKDLSLRHWMKIAMVCGEFILKQCKDGFIYIPPTFFEDESALDAEIRRRGMKEGSTFEWSEEAKEAVRGRKLTEEQKELQSIAHLGISTKKRAVTQYDKESCEVIGIYPSIAEASRKVKVDASSITLSCKGKVRTAGGYIWQYANDADYREVA